jgi:hypothetical protein
MPQVSQPRSLLLTLFVDAIFVPEWTVEEVTAVLYKEEHPEQGSLRDCDLATLLAKGVFYNFNKTVHAEQGCPKAYCLGWRQCSQVLRAVAA